jgi:hypothetical protein
MLREKPGVVNGKVYVEEDDLKADLYAEGL